MPCERGGGPGLRAAKAHQSAAFPTMPDFHPSQLRAGVAARHSDHPTQLEFGKFLCDHAIAFRDVLTPNAMLHERFKHLTIFRYSALSLAAIGLCRYRVGPLKRFCNSSMAKTSRPSDRSSRSRVMISHASPAFYLLLAFGRRRPVRTRTFDGDFATEGPLTLFKPRSIAHRFSNSA